MISFVLVVLLALGIHTSARLLPHPLHESSAIISSSSAIPILRHVVDGPNPDGSYAYSFETANGIKAEEEGHLKTGGEEGIASVRGSYSYKGDDGVDIVLSYVADENGFKPEGAHLPVAPPIPEAILKALEWIAAHPEEDNLKK